MRRQPHTEPYVGRSLTEMRRRTTEPGKPAYETQVLSLLCVAGFLLCAAGAGRPPGVRAGYAEGGVTPSCGAGMVGGGWLEGGRFEWVAGTTPCAPAAW